MRVETLEEKEKRIFEIYKQDFIKIAIDGKIRFNVIEYTCYFPKINPYKMANDLKNEGLEIVFDDSSISQKENLVKKRKLERYREEN